MQNLTAGEIFSLWEQGASGSAGDRAVRLLAAAGSGSLEQLARLPVGRRDARLIELRARAFGPQMGCLATCPACRQELECDLDASDLLRNVPPDSLPPESEAESAAGLPAIRSWVRVGDCQVEFRFPSNDDLLSLSSRVDLVENRRRLFRACVVSAWREGRQIEATALPPEVLVAVAERMAELDPHADVQLRLNCPECGHQWDSAFDIVSFFWIEIQTAAARLLREVHEIASAYGWSESQILALPPRRRQAYLELIRA